jgi:hypothetical protein
MISPGADLAPIGWHLHSSVDVHARLSTSGCCSSATECQAASLAALGGPQQVLAAPFSLQTCHEHPRQLCCITGAVPFPLLLLEWTALCAMVCSMSVHAPTRAALPTRLTSIPGKEFDGRTLSIKALARARGSVHLHVRSRWTGWLPRWGLFAGGGHSAAHSLCHSLPQRGYAVWSHLRTQRQVGLTGKPGGDANSDCLPNVHAGCASPVATGPEGAVSTM